MKIENIKVKLADLKERDDNPRVISEEDLDALKKSVKEFPEMLSVRSVVVDEDLNILGGAQRVKALLALGEEELTVQQVSGWTEEQKKQFLIKDNVSKGSWDDEVLKKWDNESLMDWGLDVNYDFDVDDDEFMGRTDNQSTAEEKERPYQFRAELTKEQYDEAMDVIDNMGLSPRNEGLTNRLGYGLMELIKFYKANQ